MKLLTFILLFFISTGIYSQIPRNEIFYINWKQEYPTLNCQPSFFWAVTRVINVNNNGMFYYKMYFQSNSRYCNGMLAGTYMNGITIWVNGYQINREKYWINFLGIYHPPLFEFWAPPNPTINFNWEYISVN